MNIDKLMGLEIEVDELKSVNNFDFAKTAEKLLKFR